MTVHTGPLRYDPFDARTQRDPFPIYRRLRDEDPVHHVADRGFWALSRFDDVFRAARDTDTFSSAQGLTFEQDEILKLGLKPTMVMMDPPEHTVFRRLVNRRFTPRKVAELEPAVRDFVIGRVERLRELGEADLVSELAGPLPSFVVAWYLGVPEPDRPQFDRWSDAIVQANAEGSVLGGAQQAVADLYGYFTGLIEERRARPGDDLVSLLLESEIDGDPVTVEEILGFAFVMIAGGNDTTTGLLGGSAELLTRHPDQRQLLVDDPGRIPDAIEELLRLTSPVQGLSRTTTREVEIHDVTIPAGRKVHLLYGSANRDPREFGDDADELDVTREIPRLLSFSSGAHHCLGAAAARLQGRVALEELLARLPDFEVDAEAGTYAPGPFVRRFQHLPISAEPSS